MDFDHLGRAINREAREVGSSHHRIDEGFSEASNDDSALGTPESLDSMDIDPPEDSLVDAASVRDWLLTRPEGLRSGLA